MNATRRRTPRKQKPATPATIVRLPRPELVRLSRVRTALQRIESGYYDRDEVRDRLASAVLEELRRKS